MMTCCHAAAQLRSDQRSAVRLLERELNDAVQASNDYHAYGIVQDLFAARSPARLLHVCRRRTSVQVIGDLG